MALLGTFNTGIKANGRGEFYHGSQMLSDDGLRLLTGGNELFLF